MFYNLTTGINPSVERYRNRYIIFKLTVHVKIVNNLLQLVLKTTLNSLVCCSLELDRGYLQSQVAAVWACPACIGFCRCTYQI